MLQASILDCVASDPFSFQQDCVASTEVHVGRRQIAQALVVALVVIVIDEPGDAGFKIARQVIVLEQDAVFERVMPAFGLALCLRVAGRAANVAHVHRACGRSVVHLPENYTDESVAPCESGGVEFGPFGAIKLVQLFVNVN
jgi:hypothetical protein